METNFRTLYSSSSSQVRRANLLEDAIDAFLSLDAEDYMKMYRFEFIGNY